MPVRRLHKQLQVPPLRRAPVGTTAYWVRSVSQIRGCLRLVGGTHISILVAAGGVSGEGIQPALTVSEFLGAPSLRAGRIRQVFALVELMFPGGGYLRTAVQRLAIACFCGSANSEKRRLARVNSSEINLNRLWLHKRTILTRFAN
jgi:hypothetical protein